MIMKLYKTLSMRFSKFLTGTLVCLGIASCGTSQYFTSYSDGIYEDAAPHREVRTRTSDPNRTFSRGISELEIEPLYEEEGVSENVYATENRYNDSQNNYNIYIDSYNNPYWNWGYNSFYGPYDFFGPRYGWPRYNGFYFNSWDPYFYGNYYAPFRGNYINRNRYHGGRIVHYGKRNTSRTRYSNPRGSAIANKSNSTRSRSQFSHSARRASSATKHSRAQKKAGTYSNYGKRRSTKTYSAPSETYKSSKKNSSNYQVPNQSYNSSRRSGSSSYSSSRSSSSSQSSNSSSRRR
jgi:hypothetical protein